MTKIRAKPWLQGLSRRTLRDIEPIPFHEIEDMIYSLVINESWPYSINTGKAAFYHARDKALMSLCFLTMGRIHEVVKLHKRQFDYSNDPEFLIIHDFNVGKRKEETIKRYGKTYIDIPISKRSRFIPFIKDHLSNIEDLLFPFKRARAFQIIKHSTGKWCHWFRSVAQRFYVNKLENPMVVSSMFEVDINTIVKYYRGSWKDHKDKLR